LDQGKRPVGLSDATRYQHIVNFTDFFNKSGEYQEKNLQ